MKYIIKNITENWGDCLASIDLENAETKEVETYECTIDAINQLARELGYISVEVNEDCLPFWLIGKEINMTLLPIDNIGGQIILPN